MSVNDNYPGIWIDEYPPYHIDSHKYHYGHVVVKGGIEYIGAAKLAAISALRMGAGLVTLAVPRLVWPVYAADCRSIMVKAMDEMNDFKVFISDDRINTVVIGPGCGTGNDTVSHVRQAIEHATSVVVDAGGLTAFSQNPEQLWSLIDQGNADVVLTPHQGEFECLFGAIEGDRVRAVQDAAMQSHATVILKGPETLISRPDGSVICNKDAPPWLATAGTGDVLAGMVGGLLARGMAGFYASVMAVWVHSQAADVIGRGLISQDIPDVIPSILQEHAVR